MIDSNVLSLQLEPTSLMTTVHLATRDFRAASEERGQTIVIEGIAALPHINADSQRLYQVFVNLISEVGSSGR